MSDRISSWQNVLCVSDIDQQLGFHSKFFDTTETNSFTIQWLPITSLGQGNMFTGVCLSTGGGVCLVPGGAWWRHPVRLLLRAVRILLECILVNVSTIMQIKSKELIFGKRRKQEYFLFLDRVLLSVTSKSNRCRLGGVRLYRLAVFDCDRVALKRETIRSLVPKLFGFAFQFEYKQRNPYNSMPWLSPISKESSSTLRVCGLSVRNTKWPSLTGRVQNWYPVNLFAVSRLINSLKHFWQDKNIYQYVIRVPTPCCQETDLNPV